MTVPYPNGYAEGFSKGEYGLTPVPRVGSYRGLLFASLSPTGISLNQHLGGAKEYIDCFWICRRKAKWSCGQGCRRPSIGATGK